MPSLDVDTDEKCLYPLQMSSAAHCKYLLNACHQSEETQLLSTLLIQKYRHIYCANSFKKCKKKKPYKTITCLQGNLDNPSANVDNNGDDDDDNDDNDNGDGNMKRPLILNDFYSKEMVIHTCCQIL